MNHTWLLVKELAYITATAAAWALAFSIPLIHNHRTRKPMKPLPTTKTFATITYIRGQYRHVDSGWFSRLGTRIIKHTNQQNDRIACYTDELLTWKPVTRK